jgi:16S rRNA (adenine1518-N6/adenine1519-N6)-dimethyltransferase
MNLTSPSQVKAWCIENGFHPNKVLGQNFLIDRNQLVSIVDAGFEGAVPDAEGGLGVLEIGPGLGVLTEEMLRRGAKVTAIEKDPVLAGRLKEALGDPPALEVIAGDALAVRAEGRFSCMVSKLPYQAGTRILL